ncbi:putative chitinase [Rhizobium ruizarguesonis]
MIDRKKFFYIASLRLHGGSLKQSQVNGYTFLLNAWEQGYAGTYPLQYLAYALATAFHETAETMMPIHEYGAISYFDKYDTGKMATVLGNTPAKDGDGYLWRGRGYVQLTGKRNYLYASSALKLPSLAVKPDLATDPHIAAQIMFTGMINGWFTGKKLKDYNLPTGFQKVNARRIINGTDKAAKIAGHYDDYMAALA